jgi:serine/threonine protein kinase
MDWHILSSLGLNAISFCFCLMLAIFTFISNTTTHQASILTLEQNANSLLFSSLMDGEGVERYVLGQRLGSGTYGTVFLAKRLSDSTPLAIKVIRDVERASKMETQILQSIHHPFIVSYYGSFVSKQKMHICMEYVPGGNLYNRMLTEKKIPIVEAKLYIAEIALALAELHKHSIVFRDLKPENVMLDHDGHVKLTDFGLASETHMCASLCGTAHYVAPEVIECKKYGPEVDWWALGILFFELLFGRPPFVAANFDRLKEKILSRDVIVPDIGENEWEIASLIQGLLEKDPKRRFGFEDLVKHPFFADMSFSDVLARRIQPQFIPETFELSSSAIAKVLWVGQTRKRMSFEGTEVVFEGAPFRRQ